jgi:PST family polysaccharide transporter
VRPRLILNVSRLTEHLRFMVDTTAWSVTMFFSRQADTLIVGKFLGAATLGFYNIAVRVMQLPVSIFGGSLHSAIYPRLVQLREDHNALRKLVLFTTFAQALLVFPPIAAVAAASEAFFTLLLSDRWQASAGIFTLLAGAGAIQTVVAINGSLLQAVGRTGKRLQLTAEYAVLLALSALIMAQFGIQAVALGSTVTTVLYLPRLLHLYLKPIECPISAFLGVLAAPSIVALAIFAAHRGLMSVIVIGPWAEAGVAVLEAIAGYAVIALVKWRWMSQSLADIRALFAAHGDKIAAPEAIEAAPEAQTERGDNVG